MSVPKDQILQNQKNLGLRYTYPEKKRTCGEENMWRTERVENITLITCFTASFKVRTESSRR